METVPQQTLPVAFKPLLWSYDFEHIDPLRDKKTIIINTINYGDLLHWKWLAQFYGKNEVTHVLRQVRQIEIRPSALRLASLLF